MRLQNALNLKGDYKPRRLQQLQKETTSAHYTNSDFTISEGSGALLPPTLKVDVDGTHRRFSLHVFILRNSLSIVLKKAVVLSFWKGLILPSM